MKTKRIIVILLSLILLCMIGLLDFRLRGSVKGTLDKEYAVSEELPLYCQDASEWDENNTLFEMGINVFFSAPMPKKLYFIFKKRHFWALQSKFSCLMPT